MRSGAAAVLRPPADRPCVAEAVADFVVEAARRGTEAVAQEKPWSGGRTLSPEVVAARRAEGDAQAAIARGRLPLGAVLLARTGRSPLMKMGRG